MYDEIDGWYDSDFWNSFYNVAPGNDVGAIDTSGNSAYLGFQIGNPGSSNPSVSFSNMNEYDENDGGFWNDIGNAFTGVSTAIGNAFSGAVQNVANAAGQNFANQITGTGNQVAANLGGNNPNPANNQNKNTVLIVGAVAVVALLAAVYFAGKSKQ